MRDTRPIVNPIVNPIADPFVNPIVDPFVNPIAKPIIKPIVNPIRKPVGWTFLWGLLMAPAAYGLQRLSGLFPESVEKWYARGFYPAVVGAWSRFTGLVPFSLMEILLVLLSIAVPVFFVFLIIRTIRAKKGSRFSAFAHPLMMAAVAASLWYAATVPLWNLNYSRPSFAALSGLDASPADAATLKAACLWLTDEANAARKAVSEDQSGTMSLADDIWKTMVKSSSGYDILSNRFPFMKGRYGQPKPVLFSRLMSWTRIVGIYTVTTAEANIDVDIPDAEIPFTTLHELAHQRGVAREDEANAAAWFASRVHPDPDFRYSGALNAWIYASNALYSADRAAWAEVDSMLSEAVKRDLAAQRAYWKPFDTVVDKVAEKANDTWLKTNGQTDGVKSYGRMVDLIIAEYRTMK